MQRHRAGCLCSVCRERRRDCSPGGLWARGNLELYLPQYWYLRSSWDRWRLEALHAAGEQGL